VNLKPLLDMADLIRERAHAAREIGASPQAKALEWAAELVSNQINEWWLEELDLDRASEERGITYSAIQKQVARGDLPNAGERGKPLVRRCDLLNGRPRRKPEPESPDMADEILRIHETR
jgi:hypothetical protein